MSALWSLVLLSWQPWTWESVDLKKVLAVLGGALLGGVAVALLSQGLTKLISGQTMPRWMIRVVAVLGAIAGGWVVALLVFSGDRGPGPGGPGGNGEGTGQTTGHTGQTSPTNPGNTGTTLRSTGRAADTLYVDVLERSEVKRLAGEEGLTARRYFRIQGQQELMTPEELKRTVERRHQDDAQLRYLDLRLQGDDSPGANSNLITDLVENWGPENKIAVRAYRPQ